jgi:uncharacterized protein with ParB-like and HNH nuclease domain
MNVYKIASRWSDTGTKESSVLDLFRKYNLVFAGRETEKIKQKVKKGDLVAISDGLKVVSIAKVIENPTAITNFSIQEEDKKRFTYSEETIAFRVEIYNLSQSEIFTTKMGTFHGMGKYSKKVEEFYSKLSEKSFQIKSYTYNIYDSNPQNSSLLQEDLQYVIPVYQRPYSWTEANIENFVNDIFISYWGVDKISSPESMFIGTMQLGDKKYFKEGMYAQEVIDGQQRITTITLFLKLLSLRYPENKELQKLDFNWLDTYVNRGKHSEYLKEVLQKNNFEDSLNKYAQNYKLIEKYFSLNIADDDSGVDFNIDDFINFLLTNLYFIVIETKAGLSKTLQIFNAINTTGLDLNNTDIFKIRFYEYLNKDCDDADTFEKIDALYESIDINNAEFGRKVVDMQAVLTIYKSFLITTHGLNSTLWRMNTNPFFEQLFDTLLNIKTHPGFKKLIDNDELLKIEDIQRIIKVRFEWEQKYYSKTAKTKDFNTMLALKTIRQSRYHKYGYLGFLYLLDEDASDKKYEELMQKLSKLYITYTLIYQKAINEMHTFTQRIFTKLLKERVPIDTILEEIEILHNRYKEKTLTLVSGDVFSSNKAKNILTRISAAMEEKKSGKSTQEIEDLVFNTKVDIEHIKARNDKEFTDEAQKELWASHLNSLGNLLILEYSINRSIGNKAVDEKMKAYRKSRFKIVQEFAKSFKTWDIEAVKKRQEIETKKIENYLYT